LRSFFLWNTNLTFISHSKIILIIINYYLDEDSSIGLNSKRSKSDAQSHNHIISRSQMPDLIRDAYAIDETYHSDYSSQKE